MTASHIANIDEIPHSVAMSSKISIGHCNVLLVVFIPCTLQGARSGEVPDASQHRPSCHLITAGIAAVGGERASLALSRDQLGSPAGRRRVSLIMHDARRTLSSCRRLRKLAPHPAISCRYERDDSVAHPGPPPHALHMYLLRARLWDDIHTLFRLDLDAGA